MTADPMYNFFDINWMRPPLYQVEACLGVVEEAVESSRTVSDSLVGPLDL